MTYKLYAAYGALAHERTPIYSDSIPATEHYDVVTVDIPDEFPLSENAFGETLIDIHGETYILNQMLTCWRGKPALRWAEGNRIRHALLTEDAPRNSNSSEMAQLRIAAGMTQQQLAEAVGVQKQAVSMWETGKSTPRADVLKRVAQVLDCSMDDLLP